MVFSHESSDEILDALVDVVYVMRLEPDRCFEYISPSVSTLVGHTPAEHYADPDLGWRIVDPRDVDALAAVVEIEVGRTADFTVRWIAKDGHVVWTHQVCRKVRRADDSVAVIGVARDMTKVRESDSMMDAAEKRYRLLALNSSDVVVSGDTQGELTWVSESVHEWLGWTPAELKGVPLLSLVHPDDAGLARQMQEALLDGDPATMQIRLLTKTGGYRWMSIIVRSVVDESGRVTGLIAGWRDIQDVQEARLAQAEAEANYHLIADNAQDVLFQSGTDGTLSWVSPSVTEVLGYQPQDLVTTSFSGLVHPDDRQVAERVKDLAIGFETDPVDVELRLREARDGWRWMRLTGRALRDSEGDLIGTLDTLRDIEGEVEARQRLEFHVTHDVLTGLGNRDLLLRQVGARERGSGCILLCFGIDNLADLAEAFTHGAGDAAVTAVAEALVASLGAQHQLFRTGDNQLTFLLAQDTDEQRLLELVGVAQTSAEGAVPVDDLDFEVHLSVGVAVGVSGNVAELLRDATSAMLRAASGGSHIEFADAALAAKAHSRIELRSGLTRAVREGRMRAWYQPVVDLAGGRLCGYEALARWVRADGSVVQPASFLPLAESSGLIVNIDDRVRDVAVASLSRLASDIHIAVNVSAASLADPGLAARVRRSLDEHGVQARRLHLEVTETTLIDVSTQVHETMDELSELGVRWWVDDFGTGYSSVSHLRDLPVFGLKLDRSFTSDLLEDERTGRLAAGLAGLARGMGLATIAEGVETAQQALVLRSLGWQWGQGWLYGKPMPDPVFAT